MAYAASAPGARLLTLGYGLALMTASGLGLVAAGGYACLLWPRRGPTWPAVYALRPLLLCAVPLGLLLTTLSGRLYLHYYITWLPALGALAALFGAAVLAPHKREPTRRPAPGALRVGRVVLAGSLVLATGSAYSTLPGLASAARSRHTRR